jgi:hypothetical protein
MRIKKTELIMKLQKYKYLTGDLLKPIYLIFGITILTLFACNEKNQITQTEQNEVYVNIEAESDFNNDSVKILLDNEALTESRITTNYTVNLAWSSGLRKISGNDCIIHCNLIEYGITGNFKIDTRYDTSTVTIIFNRNSGQVCFNQLSGLLYRD